MATDGMISSGVHGVPTAPSQPRPLPNEWGPGQPNHAHSRWEGLVWREAALGNALGGGLGLGPRVTDLNSVEGV